MSLRYLALCGLCVAATGCVAAPGSDEAPGEVIGYRYHDANHPNYIVSPSPQAIENGRRGVWLWPPAASIKPG
jgi:hypothetical protein